ncbi:class I SAM-dependent methyltransferase [Variovorax sp. VNK109]|jgi:SAM-dependent methyltransferase|uniref:class I SAM-dependent methyltransferase n=1 Tax=Variovorax sp. VNK109 TaxID=3400919 RepID=UPI003C0FA0E7
MTEQIIGRPPGLHEWFQTPPGQYLLAWEQQHFDAAVADVFGYHALQLGQGPMDALRANRMPHRWLADETLHASLHDAPPRAALLTDFAALPFPENSLDLVVLPHTLELSREPHATLREVERVLVPEGRVVLCCFNPASLWGLRQRRAHMYKRLGWGELFLPPQGEFIGYWRMRDWLRLLGFEVESGNFGCYRPSVGSQSWLRRFQWMDRAGERWWPIFGAAYMIVAIKRVHGIRMLEPGWKSSRSMAAAPVSVANRSGRPLRAPRPPADSPARSSL